MVIEEVCKMYRQGYGLRQIANILDMPKEKVVKLLRAGELLGLA